MLFLNGDSSIYSFDIASAPHGFIDVIPSDYELKESSESFFPAEIRLRKLVDEREKMIEQVRTLSVVEPNFDSLLPHLNYPSLR